MAMYGTFEDMLEAFNGGVYDFTDEGQCKGCGECCSNMLPLTNSEIKSIKRYIKANDIREQKNVLINAADMTCPFMDKSRTKDKCLIYEVRPAICRYFICSEPNGAVKHPDMYEERRHLVDMRAEFYQNPAIWNGLKALERELKNGENTSL